MPNSDGAVSAGDIQFFDNYIPSLEAGDYVLTVSQTVNSADSGHPLDESFGATQAFSVAAPRFALPPADIQSVFPPANASGVFDRNLPNIVLTKRVLPWERLIDAGNSATGGTPWMALLLFAEDEILPPAGATAPYALTNPTLAAAYPVSSGDTATDSLLTPSDPTVLGPDLTPTETDETRCKAIDISTALFEQVVPFMDELGFLAHAREVGAALASKTTDQAAGSGWFSVVIGNRFPTTSGTGRNIAHLVSLEGFSQYLCANPAWPAGITTVRLASLASWSFTCMSEAGDFATLARNLVASPIGSLSLTSAGGGYATAPQIVFAGSGGSGAMAAATVTDGMVTAVTLVQPGSGYTSAPTVTVVGGGGSGATATASLLAEGGDMLRLRIPVSAAPQTVGSPAAFAQAALLGGYAPLAYDTRVGDRTFGWYHGPLVPNPIEVFSAPGSFPNSAAATIYDEITGTFDLTYAAAWETGRLLALANRSQSTAVAALGKSLRKELSLLRGSARLGVEPAALGGPSEADGPLSRSFVDWLGRNLPSRLPKPGVRARRTVRRESSTAPRPVSAADDLRALIGHLDTRPHMMAQLETFLCEPKFSALLDFQAGLQLLEGVPFEALVPNAAMLPAESIRFFYIDPNYLTALADGAGSIGQQTMLDAALSQVLRKPLRQAATSRARTLRSRRTGRPPAAIGTDDAGAPVAGFLLRSALVSGWPGLEINSYLGTLSTQGPIEPDPATLISPLRLERLAPDVLLCLYPQIPVWIELDEPKEGLAFGVEDPVEESGPPQVALRYLDNSTGQMGQASGITVSMTSDYIRDPATGVVDIASWQAYLSTQVPPSSTAWGPAAFALQMICAPEQMVFQVQPNPAPLQS